jgi:hypothetical protein
MKGLWKQRQTITAIVFWVLFLGSIAFVRSFPALDMVWVFGGYLFLLVVAVFSLIQTFRDHKERGQFSYRGVPRWLGRFLSENENSHR